MSTEQAQVQVRFVTQQAKYAVSESAILVPVNFKRYGLSEIINNLLQHEKPIPFDFLIDGELLRSSLSEYLAEKQLSTENLLTIEYVESMLPPTPLAAFQHDDWISSVKGYQGLFLTGSYDNMMRLWNSSGDCVATFLGHKDAVKSVAFGTVDATSEAMLFSGSLDHSILAWNYSFEDEAINLLYEFKGHTAPVECISVNADATHLASASADGIIRVWTTDEPEEDEAASSEKTSLKKKRKTEKTQECKTKTKAVKLEGHVGAVSSVVYDKSSSNIVYSGGWDHSVRSWDVEQQVNLVTKNSEKVVLGIDYSPVSRLLASGHTDNAIRLWDPRAEDGANVKLVLRGHTGWASTVSWSNTSEYTLCSGSYDGTVRVWDIRSKGALYTMNPAEATENKVFGVHWDGKQILSGGEDKQLRIYQTSL